MKRFYFICPYLDDNHSASFSYIINLSLALSEHNKVYLFSRKKVTRLLSHKGIYQRKMPNILSFRLVSIFLINYWLSKSKHNYVISDVNPFICFFNSSRVFHIIHHINDIPFLSHQHASINTHLFKVRTKLLAFVSNFLWRVSLVFSPTKIITVSETVKKDILSVVRRKDITVIRNFNPLEKYSSPSSLSSKTSIQYDIIMIGNNIPRKNYTFAAKVINKVSNLFYSNFNKKLRVCVVGASTNDLIHLFNDKIIFEAHSNISDKSLARLLSLSKIFLNR